MRLREGDLVRHPQHKEPLLVKHVGHDAAPRDVWVEPADGVSFWCSSGILTLVCRGPEDWLTAKDDERSPA